MAERERRVPKTSSCSEGQRADRGADQAATRHGRRPVLDRLRVRERRVHAADRIDASDYRSAKADPARFVVLPAHVIPDTEHVVVEKDEPTRSELQERAQ